MLAGNVGSIATEPGYTILSADADRFAAPFRMRTAGLGKVYHPRDYNNPSPGPRNPPPYAKDQTS